MRISANPASLNLKQRVAGTDTTSFAEKIRNTRASPSKSKKSDLPISREELLALANDFKSGQISKEQAHKRFVSTIINNSIKNELGERDRQKLMEVISDFFADDKDFLQKLTQNLNRLA